MYDAYFRFLEFVQQSGIEGLVVFVLAYIAGCVLLIPGFVFTCAAGVLFGFVKGSLCVWVGAVSGACLSFIAAKFFLQGRLGTRLRTGGRLATLSTLISNRDWKMVALIRLCPLFPFRICNYLLGLTRLKFSDYMIGTAIGTLPSALTYVYLGFSVGSLAELGRGEASIFAPEHRAVLLGYLAGLALVIAVITLTGRKTRSMIHSHLRHPPEGA
jgi:uncharacterized membrane protein YdjX (TVP38/TMEM64 family)